MGWSKPIGKGTGSPKNENVYISSHSHFDGKSGKCIHTPLKADISTITDQLKACSTLKRVHKLDHALRT